MLTKKIPKRRKVIQRTQRFRIFRQAKVFLSTSTINGNNNDTNNVSKMIQILKWMENEQI